MANFSCISNFDFVLRFTHKTFRLLSNLHRLRPVNFRLVTGKIGFVLNVEVGVLTLETEFLQINQLQFNFQLGIYSNYWSLKFLVLNKPN